MTRRKSQLSLQRPKNSFKKKKNISVNSSSLKRKHMKTPTATPRKPSFKSPLYLASPAYKRTKVKSARSLFHRNDNDIQSPCVEFEELDTLQILDEEVLQEKNTNENVLDNRFLGRNTSSNVGMETTGFKSNTPTFAEVIKEMESLLPDVVKNLGNYERLDLKMLQFFRQIKDKRFPLNNTAYLLWCEVVDWLDCSSTTNMRYSAKTKQFWKLGWKIFGGKFINFMGGYKSHGDTILKLSERGKFAPASSEINFAVPDVQVLRTFDPYEVMGERKPGIFLDIISELSINLRNKSACLTFDGKKLKQVLKQDSGDVDLIGFEKGETLTERRDNLQQSIEEINEVIEQMTSESKSETNVDNESDNESLQCSSNAKHFLLEALQRITRNVIEVTQIKRKKEYCKTKLIERGGETDWRKGKFVYAISAIIAFIYDIDQYLSQASDVSERICKCISSINGAVYVSGDTINLEDDNRYFEIDNQIGPTGSTRLVKQRSKKWHEIRNEAKVTGSTIYGAIGCDGLKKMKTHFEKVVCGIPEKEPSAEVKRAMEHGTNNEINGVATIVGRIMPTLEPDKVFCEEGCVQIEMENAEVIMVVSPDGSIRGNNTVDTTNVAVEIKCPVNGIHTQFPARYLLQCLSEIEALNAAYLLYVCWTEYETLVFKVERNINIFTAAMKIAMDMYGISNPKKPTKLNDEQRKLKADIIEESKRIPIIGRFQSLKATNKETSVDTSKCDINEIKDVSQDIADLYRKHFELNRERATEAIVFLIADLDRSWDKKKIRCSPVAWFPKGYSLTTALMREIAEEVLNQCHSAGLHVPCQSFDGQWHGIVARSVDEKPLTLYQLQRDVWNEAEKLSKKAIVNILKSLNTVIHWDFVVLSEENNREEPQLERRVIMASNAGTHLPVYRPRKCENTKQKGETDTDKETIEETTLADIVPEVVSSVNGHSENLLQMITISEKEELEAFIGNVNEENWANEIEDLQNSQRSEDINRIEPEMEEVVDNRDVTDESNFAPSSKDSCLEEVQFPLNIKDMEYILALFQSTKGCYKKGKWNAVTPEALLLHFSSSKKLETFLDIELRVIINFMKKKDSTFKVKESIPKYMKIKELTRYLNVKYTETETRSIQGRKHPKQPRSLSEIAIKAVEKYSKQDLNIILAEYNWKDRYTEWVSTINDVCVNNDQYEWFYQPEYNIGRHQLEVKCIDSTHLLTRTRRKCCKGGLNGLSNEGWIRAAKSNCTLLTRIMVEEITDPMSVSMAKTHFSESVESVMRNNGDVESANLCRDVRHWWESEDNAGIPAAERVLLRQSLRRRLLQYVDFGRFPPPTMNVQGWPVQLWEGILANIDAKVLLYCLCHSSTYNVRAFSSMIGETFFAELTNNDKRGQGTVTCEEFGQFIGNTIEQVQIRMDPERTFSYCTSRSTVYEAVEDAESTDDISKDTGGKCRVCEFGAENLPVNIVTKNHHFDSAERKRLAGRRQQDTVSTSRNCLHNRALGVRWNKARCNIEKMLTTDRMGISSGLSPNLNKS